MTHNGPLCTQHEPRTTRACAADVRAHERAQYATPPYLPTVPTYPKNSDSPSTPPSSTSTREPRSGVDGNEIDAVGPVVASGSGGPVEAALLARVEAAEAGNAELRAENEALRASLREQDDATPSARRSADYWLRQTQKAEADLAAAVAKLRAVEALHFTRGRNILGQPVCNECSPLQPMPCPTLRALADPVGPKDERPARPQLHPLAKRERGTVALDGSAGPPETASYPECYPDGRLTCLVCGALPHGIHNDEMHGKCEHDKTEAHLIYPAYLAECPGPTDDERPAKDGKR